jgi:hypothetical protein
LYIELGRPFGGGTGGIYSNDGRNLYAFFRVTVSNGYWDEDPLVSQPYYQQPPSNPTMKVCYDVWEEYVAWTNQAESQYGSDGGTPYDPLPAVIESGDAGQTWHVLPLPPDPFSPAYDDVSLYPWYLLPTHNGVVFGSSEFGWTTWSRLTRSWSPYAMKGSSLGMLFPTDETYQQVVPNPGPLPADTDPRTYRYLANGRLWMYVNNSSGGYGTQPSRSTILLSQGGRITGRQAIRISVPVVSPGGRCQPSQPPPPAGRPPKLRVPPETAVREALASADGKVTWALTGNAEWVYCGRTRAFAQVNSVVLRSTDGGAQWTAIKTPAGAYWLQAVDGHAIVVGFSSCGSGNRRRIARYDNGHWRSLGCEPISDTAGDD